MTPEFAAAAPVSGGLVGFSLGLVGGGGSMLATPLLLYLVGLEPSGKPETIATSLEGDHNARYGSASLFRLLAPSDQHVQ